MIFQLIKRDPAWKFALGLAFLASFAMQIPGLGNPLIILVPMVLGSFFRPQQRATEFEVSLPISARDLFLARLLSLLTVVWFPFVTGELGCHAAIGWSMNLLECAALATLLILLPLAARVERPACPVWMVAAAWIDGITLGWAGLHFLSPAVFLVLCALATGAVFLKSWTAIPPSFQVAPLVAVAQRSSAARPRPPAPGWWVIARFALSWWYLPLGVAVLVLSFLGGWWLLWAFVCSTLLYSSTRFQTRWLEALPIPRRAFLLVALIPMALPLIVGAVLGSMEWRTEPRHAGTLDVQVPVRYWRHAPGGVPPVVKAPWGETVQPATVTVLGYAIYNPYAVGPRNSARFLDWQYARAMEKAYQEWSHPSDPAVGRPAGWRPDLSPPNVQILYVAAVFLLALGEAWCEELNYWFRLLRRLLWRMLAGGLATGAAFWALFASPWLGDRLPRNTAIVAAIAAVPVLLMTWLLDRQFRHSDQPPSMSRPRA